MFMKIVRAYILSLALVLPLVSVLGCSVKETREECPKYVNMNFHENEEALTGRVSVLGWDGEVLFRDDIDASELDRYWVKAVQEGLFDLSVCSGLLRSLPSGRIVSVPSGAQADSLYAYYTSVDTRNSDVVETVNFHKQFCTVNLDISRSAEEMLDYRFVVSGNTCGFDLFSFVPVDGEYVYEPEVVPGEEKIAFRILRQVDDSLSLEIWRRREVTKGDGEKDYVSLGKFPLGKYIAKTGYSWSGEDLDDVFVKFGFALEYIQIGVDGWEEGTVFRFIEQ